MAKFEKLFPFLENQGWAMIEDGDGGGFLYVRPTSKVKRFGLLIEHLEEGIDYFKKKKDVETWVNERENVVLAFAVYQSSNEMSQEEKKKKEKKTDGFTDKESRALEALVGADMLDQTNNESKTVRIGSDQEAQRSRMLDESSQHLSYFGWNLWLERTVMSFGGWRALECSSIREGSNDFHRAPLAESVSGHQFRAQYGRANSHLVQTCIQEAQITRKDRFIDIGSGIGQVVLQIASCVGCPSIGIELLGGRHDTAKELERLHRHFAQASKIAPGCTLFIHGDFTAPKHQELVSKATVFFVNNAQGTFGVRCVKAGTMTLDMQLAALARSVGLGSRFICFDPIYELESAELSRVFRRRTFRTLPSATDWSTDSLELTLYVKIANKWTCSRCTFANNLLNAAGEPVTSCEVCDEDPNGMQRESYVTRRRTAPTPMQDLTGPSVKQQSLTKKNLVKVKQDRQSASKSKPKARPPMPSKIAAIGASVTASMPDVENSNAAAAQGGGVDAEAWEQCKENAMPIKRGRDPKKLKPFGAQSEIANRKAKLAQEQEAFEEALAQATSDGPMEDPLSTWIRYIKWTQDNFPSGSNDLLSLLERCTREFKGDERYKNNEKYLKVWIGYADLLTNPSSVFKYLRENKIGEKLALYYVATAWTAERRGDFPLADKAYSVGLEKQATPVELLKKRHREFQRRMSRRWLEQAERERNGETDPETEEAEASRARSLQTISRSEAASMHRPAANSRRAAAANPNISGRPGLGVSTSGNEANAQADRAGSRFAVFEQTSSADPWRKDDWGDENRSSDSAARDDGPGWKHLASVSDLQKENALDPAPWTHQGFGPGRTAPARRPTRDERGATDGQDADAEPKFDIYVEDGPGGVRSPRSSIEEGAGLKVRAKAEKSEAEMLMKKPLQNFDAKKPPQTTRTVETPSHAVPPKQEFRHKPEKSRVSEPESPADVKEALDVADQEDMTINTRLALDDMFEMFGSPSMKRASAEGKSTKKSNNDSEDGDHNTEKARDAMAESFHELHDEDDQRQEAKARGTGEETLSCRTGGESAASGDEEEGKSHTSERKPFSIFGDSTSSHEDAQDPEMHDGADASRPSKPFSIFGSDEDDSRHEETPFSIFGDSDMASEKLEQDPPRSRKPFAIFSEAEDEDADEGNGDVSTLSFAPLEAILESTGEADESVNSSMSRHH
ncbi:Histone-lysine N-methyltransferase, H3 lysine-79 specific [Hondaea fermentalgiana]|uniref:Histone-lysine N-methyltransferase, H3 lysine-79 specific n=1 Tax=Hondaea fermentalgiana TaxID=2315210 RepID=A0A2R5GKP9_9STRA|nr:Histone-lysine N-methyltransferase, H3 lysine-79 specific [Hondaea fermentalgiana]|eukprot:GBG31482.1 Histone-lysine N-methyltransferase, H3 lysine-79 specific [Hondaea fermentalgiana]